jgi:tetratricopeptide (TPR) repeat protein
VALLWERPREVRELAESGLALAGGDADLGARFLGWSPLVALHAARSQGLLLEGHIDEAEAVAQVAYRMARDREDAAAHCVAAIYLLRISSESGDSGRAIAYGREAVRVSSDLANPILSVVSRLWLGMALVDAGHHHADAIEVLESVLEDVDRWSTGCHWRPLARLYLALARVRAGGLERARLEAEQAKVEAHTCGDYEIRTALVLCEVRARCGELESARGTLAEAERRIREQGMEVERPRVSELSGLIRSLEGDEEGARRDLQDAIEAYTAMGAAARAERIAAELAS